jgi:hypothetical protein
VGQIVLYTSFSGEIQSSYLSYAMILDILGNRDAKILVESTVIYVSILELWQPKLDHEISEYTTHAQDERHITGSDM